MITVVAPEPLAFRASLGMRAVDHGAVGPGYHLADIPRGKLGELSKIEEEVAELRDANTQGVKIMELVELSDLIGAVRCYLSEHHPDTTLDDLVKMSDVTARAFHNGHRT